MARSVFVDTSAWYALIDRREESHRTTSGLVRRLVADGVRLVSTDYVLDESYTLARARSGTEAALALLDMIEGTSALDIEWIGSERFDRAVALFRRYHDQTVSFTDCTSFAVMRERGLTDALTWDQHFRIAGFNLLLEA